MSPSAHPFRKLCRADRFPGNFWGGGALNLHMAVDLMAGKGFVLPVPPLLWHHGQELFCLSQTFTRGTLKPFISK